MMYAMTIVDASYRQDYGELKKYTVKADDSRCESNGTTLSQITKNISTRPHAHSKHKHPTTTKIGHFQNSMTLPMFKSKAYWLCSKLNGISLIQK